MVFISVLTLDGCASTDYLKYEMPKSMYQSSLESLEKDFFEYKNNNKKKNVAQVQMNPIQCSH